MGLGCLLSIMPHYTMAVKSALAGRFRKCFGEWRLEPVHGCGEDAIFAGFGARISFDTARDSGFDSVLELTLISCP